MGTVATCVGRSENGGQPGGRFLLDPGPDLLLGRPEAGAGERAEGKSVVPEQDGEADTAGVHP